MTKVVAIKNEVPNTTKASSKKIVKAVAKKKPVVAELMLNGEELTYDDIISFAFDIDGT